MLKLCKSQITKSKEAFVTHDSDLAEEVIHTENRVNALDLKIDRDCEKFLALYNPVASDLRFVLALRKINFDLERIGDHAYGISKFIIDLDTPIEKNILELLHFDEMFMGAISMLDDICEAYDAEDTKKARKVFKKDKVLDKYNLESFKTIAAEIKKQPENAEQYLVLFSVIKKIERIGDLLTNIAEELIFYREAEILKHKNKKK